MQGVKPGTRFPNTFSQKPGFIICGFNGTTLEQECITGTAFDPESGGCVMSPKVMAVTQISFCENSTDGVYARKNISGDYEVCLHTEPNLCSKSR